MSDLNGIINVIKPAGMTSFNVVTCIKRALQCKKAGHTGTLDPLAAGLMSVCTGKATKIIPYLPEEKKEYIGELTFGITTNTLDREGKITQKNNLWKKLTEKKIEKTFADFAGKLEQIPPMFSAVHHQGKRLYKMARKGKEVKRESRQVTIYKNQIINISLPVVQFRVICSRGTYIRSLARDIGEELETGAHLSFLVRTGSGPFKLKNAYTFKEIKQFLKNNDYKFIVPMDQPLDFPKVFITEKAHKKAVNGMYLTREDIQSLEKEPVLEEKVVIYDQQNNFISINKITIKDECLIFKPLRVFV